MTHLAKDPNPAAELERALEHRASDNAEDPEEAQGLATELALLTPGRMLATP